ncbi:MAG: hypothetical protein IPJ61_11475 [Tessaracoccus sp.]|nr:hypothetical protein [Tessaracoccus sp.]MBK7821660.1 hypothetical protein [Tessaracoccus sp.]
MSSVVVDNLYVTYSSWRGATWPAVRSQPVSRRSSGATSSPMGGRRRR